MEEKPLSNFEILAVLKNRPNLLLYGQLKSFNNIFDAMGPNNELILLYETPNPYEDLDSLNQGRFGHWACLFLNQRDELEFFNSYGVYPDEELLKIPENFRKESNQDKPHLSCLLQKSGKKLVYNDFRFQKKEPNVNTCGRWCVLRLLMKNIDIDSFIEIFDNNEFYDSDDLASLFTSFIDIIS